VVFSYLDGESFPPGGRFLQPNGTRMAVVDKHYEVFFTLDSGAEVKIGGEPFRVVGIIEAQEGSQAAAANFYIPLADLESLGRLNVDAVNQIYLHSASVGSGRLGVA
jgi:hypothetical protein